MVNDTISRNLPSKCKIPGIIIYRPVAASLVSCLVSRSLPRLSYRRRVSRHLFSLSRSPPLLSQRSLPSPHLPSFVSLPSLSSLLIVVKSSLRSSGVSSHLVGSIVSQLLCVDVVSLLGSYSSWSPWASFSSFHVTLLAAHSSYHLSAFIVNVYCIVNVNIRSLSSFAVDVCDFLFIFIQRPSNLVSYKYTLVAGIK